ncbi:GntR family transcriptional regulator [Lacticaseibacillus saniviri]
MVQRESKFDIKTLTNRMIQAIQNGEIGDDRGKLPSEPALMAEYGVTRYTLRETLAQLGKLGYIFQAHGIGTFVRPHHIDGAISLQNVVGLTEEMARQGKVVKTVAVSQREVTVAEADFLPDVSNLTSDQVLISIIRQRTIDDAPALVEHSYYLKSVIDSIPDEALYGQLFGYVEQQTKFKVGFIDSVIGCEMIDAATGDFFGLPAGAPSLTVQDDSYLSSGQLVAFSKLYYDYRATKLFMFKKMH